MKVVLSRPQAEFVFSTAKFPAFIGGYGSGKTEAMVMRALVLMEKSKNIDIAVYFPTFELAKRIGLARFTERLQQLKVPITVNKSELIITILAGGTIMFRTMTDPSRIVGYNVDHSFVDEIDTLPANLAMEIWIRIIARNRKKIKGGAINTVAVSSTPEGFRFCYDMWGKEEKEGYELIRASTYSNEKNLPIDYIDSLKQIYPHALLAAYLHGEFCNLVSGQVYPNFSREYNSSNETAKPEDTLHIGMDFNVGRMAAVIIVERGDCLHVVDELTGLLDTPAMCAAIMNRYPRHEIRIYPDASGSARTSSSASSTDFSILRNSGFKIISDPANPLIRDRILACNAMLLNGAGQRRFFIRVDKCKKLVDALEQQAYKGEEPDKTMGHDHVIDSMGYCLVKLRPIRRVSATNKVKIVGF